MNFLTDTNILLRLVEPTAIYIFQNDLRRVFTLIMFLL